MCVRINFWPIDERVTWFVFVFHLFFIRSCRRVPHTHASRPFRWEEDKLKLCKLIQNSNEMLINIIGFFLSTNGNAMPLVVDAMCKIS